MKKILSVLLALVLMLGALPFATAETAEPAPSFATIADALDEKVSTGYWIQYPGYVVTIAKVGDRYIRVVAELDEETDKKFDELYAIDDIEVMLAKQKEMAAAQPVSYTEDITSGILDQAALDAAVGKSIKDLKADGWEVTSYGFADHVEFDLRSGLFEYTCVMNETPELFNQRYESGDFDDFTVKSIAFANVSGSAVDLQYQADGTFVPSQTQEMIPEGYTQLIGQLLALTAGGSEEDLNAALETLEKEYPEAAEEIRKLAEILPYLKELGEPREIPEAAAPFAGSWQCDRASVEVRWEQQGFVVVIEWSSSASEATEWRYACIWQEADQSLKALPFGTCTEYVYADDGSVSSTKVVYDDGEAVFTLDADGHLLWDDRKEDAGKGMKFERISE